MTATRKGVARKKAARKSKGLKTAAVVAAPKAKPVFNPVPNDLMTKVLAAVTGGLALRKSLAAHGVVAGTFFATVDRDSSWAEQYARARASLMDSMAEDLVEIQDEEPPLRCPGGESPGDAKADAAWVTWQKNRIDTRKWLLSKLAPRKYGDRVEQILTGADGGPIKQETKLICDEPMAALAVKIAARRAA